MGYQEAFRPIGHLAEAVGIRKAMLEYRECHELPGYCTYYCTTRRRADNALFVCVGGDRCVVSRISLYYLDDCIPYEKNYSDLYEDIEERLVEVAAKERPDLVELGYEGIKPAFERMIEETREWERALREEANELWPQVVKFIKDNGPSRMQMFECSPVFKGHHMLNVLTDLEWQGLLESSGSFYKDEIKLTGKALEQLGIEGMPEWNEVRELIPEQKLVLALKRSGSLTSTKIAMILDLNYQKTMKLLKQLMRDGRIVHEGRGRSSRYRLAKGVPEFEAI